MHITVKFCVKIIRNERFFLQKMYFSARISNLAVDLSKFSKRTAPKYEIINFSENSFECRHINLFSPSIQRQSPMGKWIGLGALFSSLA